ncbi:MAG: ankyrin repeat domain-containing protein [Synergistaceae bacterium]|nr:ankyrin repeat domain-containing protein [Synergistaceae bacterium]
MESRFEFLEEQFPKLAGYGEKAEEALNSDNNICLLNLGRIAETITSSLCRASHIDEKIPFSEALEELSKLGAVDSDIARKIETLMEVKDEAEEGYDSAMAGERLLTTARELCEWFVLTHGESKFSFLSDLFLPGRFIPPLSNLAEIGREAEDNLYTNTRYCLICLGDMGEAIVDYLMSTNNVETHERDQMYRIDNLFKAYVITDEIKDSLHDLRIARNKAVHERYDNNYTSEEEASRLLNEVLKLCEWLFQLVLKPGYIVKGRISELGEESVSVRLGKIPAEVPTDEIPLDEDTTIEESYIKGQKYIFKVLEKNREKITLSLRQADEDYNLNVAQQYSKYKIGQDIRVIIKRISNSTGALVELKDGLLAQIPPSEIGRRLYDYDESNTKQIKYEVTARFKWFSHTQYPPMLLSVKEIEDEQRAKDERTRPTKWEKIKTPPKRNTMRDLNFRTLCKTGSLEQILEALDSGANPNARNNNNTTALMTAAQSNHDAKVIEALLDAGAELEARNHKGNTALHFAAMENNPEVVKILCERGADIEALNHDKKTPLDYARSNRTLNDTEVLQILTPDSSPVTETKAKPGKQKKNHQPTDNINFQLLDLCKSGTPEEIAKLIEDGANVNTTSHNSTTPLMTAAQYNTLETVRTLLSNNADVNLQNKMGNTALHFAAAYSTPEVISELINAGANVDVANSKGKTPRDFAQNNSKLKAPEIIEKLFATVEAESIDDIKRNFLRICRSGSEEEISHALDLGVDANLKNKSLSTALMFAARNNTAEAVDILVKAGAYLNSQDIYGNTALIYAADNNTDDVVGVLLDAGADIELKNIAGFSAFDYARKNYRLADSDVLEKMKLAKIP